jgi:hypothetical protein
MYISGIYYIVFFRQRILLNLFCLLSLFVFLSCHKKVQRLTDLDTSNNTGTNLSDGGIKIINNTVYDLGGKEIEVSGTLVFKGGGKIVNGTIKGNKTKIMAEGKFILFENVKIKGTWDVPEGFLYWFTDGRDPIRNFSALCNLIEMGAVCVLDKMYPVSTASKNEYYNTTRAIEIRGMDRQNCGLILKTKHTFSNAYFRSIKGNDISLKNMTLVTEDYMNKVKPAGYDYYFAWSYYSSADRESKPDMNYIKIESCDILGAITFRYSSSAQNTTPPEMLNTGIDSIIVTGNRIEDCVSLLELSNGRYDMALVQNNEIKNIYGPVFYFPLGDLTEPFSPTELSKRRKIFDFRGNHVYNEKPVISTGEGYMSSFVVKGAEINIENNIFENLINLNDAIETVPFYTSALYQSKIKNNKVVNCLGRGFLPVVGGSNCFLRIRGSRNVYVENNIFELNRKALVALSLLDKESSQLKTVDIKRFRFGLWSANLNAEDFTSKYVFTNNIFKVAVLSDHSILSRSQVLCKGNKIFVQYLAKYDDKNWGTSGDSHDGSLIVIRDKTQNGNLIFENNEIEINESASDRFLFIKDVNDNKDFSLVSYNNNIFRFDGEVSIAMPRTKVLTVTNQLAGEGYFSYNEATTNSSEITIQSMNVIQKIYSYKAGEIPPFHIKMAGSATISADKNQDSVIHLMNIRFQDLYTNQGLKKSPVIVNVTGEYIQKNGTKIKEEFQVLVKDFSNLYYMGVQNKPERTSTFWTPRGDHYRNEVVQMNGARAKYPLTISSAFRKKSVDNSGYLFIKGTGDVKSFEITLHVETDINKLKNETELIRHVKKIN